MGKYKSIVSIQLSHEGELKTELQKDSQTEITPVESIDSAECTPDVQTDETVQEEKIEQVKTPKQQGATFVDAMGKIVENAKLMDEYEVVNGDLKQTIEICNATRLEFDAAIKTLKKSGSSVSNATKTMLAASKGMETVCNRIVEILCRVESFKFIVELDDKSKNLLDEHRKEIVRQEMAFMNKHEQNLEARLTRHRIWMEDQINGGRGFWFSSKNGWIFFGIFALCFIFTLMFCVCYIRLKITGGHIYI